MANELLMGIAAPLLYVAFFVYTPASLLSVALANVRHQRRRRAPSAACRCSAASFSWPLGKGTSFTSHDRAPRAVDGQLRLETLIA
jgi:hypothetical protein